MASATGPASAIDTGIRASETKKSRLDTRPSMADGTRRCSRVPHSTWPLEKANPTTNRATDHHPELVRSTRPRPAGADPTPQQQHHQTVR